MTAPGVLNGIPWAMLPGMRGRAFTLAVLGHSMGRASRCRVRRATVARVSPSDPRVARGKEEAVRRGRGLERRGDADGRPRRRCGAVTDLASRVDVLHVAAHGRHAVDNPLFSGLELADGALFGYDIDLMPDVPGDRRAVGLRGRPLSRCGGVRRRSG